MKIITITGTKEGKADLETMSVQHWMFKGWDSKENQPAETCEIEVEVTPATNEHGRTEEEQMKYEKEQEKINKNKEEQEKNEDEKDENADD